VDLKSQATVRVISVKFQSDAQLGKWISLVSVEYRDGTCFLAFIVFTAALDSKS